MEHIVDCKVTKVYPGPSGKSEHGEWKIWNLYLDKGDGKKFGYMWGGKKPIPHEGMQVKHIEYEIELNEKDGKTYQNYNIKKLEIDSTSKPEAIPNAKEDMGLIPGKAPKNDRKVSFYVAYAKDIAVAMLINGGDLINLEAVCSQVAKAGVKLMNESLNNGQISPQVNKTVPPLEDSTKDKGEGKGTSPQQEEDRKLRATLKKYHKANEALFYETIGLHGAEKGEEVIEFAKEAQDSLLRDLEKEFKEPDF